MQRIPADLCPYEFIFFISYPPLLYVFFIFYPVFRYAQRLQGKCRGIANPAQLNKTRLRGPVLWLAIGMVPHRVCGKH